MKIHTKKIFILLTLLSICVFVACSSVEKNTTPVLNIAIPYEEQLLGINDEYYKQWLKEKSGLNMEFTFIPRAYANEYLSLLFAEENSEIDAVFFSENSAPSLEDISFYGKQGYLATLEELIDTKSIYLKEAIAEHENYDLKQTITQEDGHIYYMPALDWPLSTKNFQTLWVNIDYLENLGMTMPKTTEEFRLLLKNIANNYPNSAPIIGSKEYENTFVCNFIMNSFILCDPKNSYMALEDGKVIFAPITQSWREGLKYLNELYKSGFLPKQNFSYEVAELVSICNDPRNLVGAFTSESLSFIISEESPELLSRYIAIPPLKGPKGIALSPVEKSLPRIGGVIIESSQMKKEVFELMDLMCSKEAFLIGNYGKKGEDWEASKVGDITIDGEVASITIKNDDKLSRDKKKNLVGPFIAQQEYVRGVTWKGYQTNQSEYLDARANRIYEPYIPKEPLKAIAFYEGVQKEKLEAIGDYTKSWMIDFVMGQKNIEDDIIWDEYIRGFDKYELESTMKQIEKYSYEKGDIYG